MNPLLSELIAVLKPGLREGRVHPDFPVTGIVNDSRQLQPDNLFVAIPGARCDGHRFLTAAEQAGARAAVITDPAYYLPDRNRFLVTDAYAAYALLAERFAGSPAHRLQLAGVTGTNGKTTIAFMLHRMLTAAGHPCGLISTIEYCFGNRSESADRTTPEAGKLQQLFSGMVASGCTHAVMEVSSHALSQTRTGTARFAVAIFTNLTGDHLDYHRTMENYYQCKKRLFAEHTAGPAVINLDDPWGKRLAGELPGVRVITYGKGSECAWRIGPLTQSPAGVEFVLTGPHGSFRAAAPLPGEHNAYNLTAALAAADCLGLDPEAANAAVKTNFAVPGRLQYLALPNGAAAYVDYAHTDDALAHVLDTLRPLCRGRLLVVFGCGGDRDKTKRPRMGAVAAAKADLLFLTSDNPRTEDPLKIIADVRAGIPAGSRLTVESDRRLAIAAAFRQSEPGDLLLVAGKGHEDYQEINGVKHHFSDLEILGSLVN